ncbi:MAG: hypothetical protein RI565_11165 [Schleiferiaceae bacterium]|nr:hypothetical protein [Schleiferiaceae bacterium]
MAQEIVIVGAGGLGREVAAMISRHFSQKYSLAGFVDDQVTPHDTVNGKYVLGDINWLQEQPATQVVIALGDPGLRQKVQERLAATAHKFPALVHPGAEADEAHFVQIGEGSIVLGGTVLTTNISLGKFVLVNQGCSLNHDTHVGHFSTLMPGVRISGSAQVGERSYLGTGTIIASYHKLPAETHLQAGTVME